MEDGPAMGGSRARACWDCLGTRADRETGAEMKTEGRKPKETGKMMNREIREIHEKGGEGRIRGREAIRACARN